MGCVEGTAIIKEDDGSHTNARTFIMPDAGTSPRKPREPFQFQGHCLLNVRFRGWELIECVGSPQLDPSDPSAYRIGVDLGPYEAWVYY